MRKAIIWICLLQVALVVGAFAQANRASITGTIEDASAALMAGVDVSARNTETNVVTTTVSNEDGIYLLPNLPPGTYELTFKKTGFKEVLQPSVTLISTQVARIGVVMQVGAATDNVTVTAGAPVLDTETVSIGTNITGQAVADLPLSIYGGGRAIETFAVALTPGYSPYSNPYGAVINGSQWFTKEYTVDGTSATATIRGNSFETAPNLESVSELQAQTSGLDAASAITSGGVMSFTLKSGTNQFHGSLFGYGHNEFLDANSWTNGLTNDPKPKARAWDYGGSIGGPVFRNKLFFFGSVERYTQNDFTLGGFSGFVPTAAMLNGDFSALLGNNLCTDSGGGMGDCGTSNGNGGTFSNPVTVQNKAGQTVALQRGMIFDPATCTAPGQNCKQFTSNTIDTPISTVAQKINAIFQKDYAPESSDLTANNRLVSSNSPSQTPIQAVVKMDYDLTSHDRFSGSWTYNNRPRTLVDSGGIWAAGSTDGGPLAAARLQRVNSDQHRISESHTFANNLLNVFNVTYNWYKQGDKPASGSDWNSQLGFGDTGASNFPVISFGDVINGHGVTYIGNDFRGGGSGATLLLGDTVTWVKGRHSISFGGEFRAYQINSHKGEGTLRFSFLPNTTDGGYTGVAGFGFATYLLGTAASASQSTPFDLYGRRKSMSLFAQDSYKITPKLTLTGGLRWQYAKPFHEKYGHWANYDLEQIDPNYGFPGKLVFAKNGDDSFEKKEYWDGFGPQIGFAYAPSKKWVVRGSFGLTLLPASGPFFEGVPGGSAPGFQGINQVNQPFNWDTGYPGVFQPGDKNVNPQNVFPLVSVDPHALMPAFTDTINIGVQYEINPTTRIEVAYVGNRGHHLPDTALAWNEPSSSTFLNVVNANPGLVPYGDFSSWQFAANCKKGDPLYNAYTGVPYVGLTCPYDNFSGTALAALAPSPQAASWAASYYFYYNLNYVGLPLGQTSYNSMVVELVKRTGRDLTGNLNYTYSRQRGDTFSAQQEFNGYYSGVQDFQNLSAAANSFTGYDATHIVKGYFAYQLPFGRGKRWLSNNGGFLNGLVGGWQLNGLVLYQTGQPLRVGVNSPFYPIWSNFYPNFHYTGADGPFDPGKFQAGGDPVYLFTKDVATSPIMGNNITFGTGGLSDGRLRCPGYANENASLLKSLSFGEGRYQLQMRVEFYNLFNRHYYDIQGCGGRQTNVGDDNFAQVLGVSTKPRNGQFGLRFTF